MIKLTLDTTLQKLNISRYELAKRTGIQYQIIDNYIRTASNGTTAMCSTEYARRSDAE